MSESVVRDALAFYTAHQSEIDAHSPQEEQIAQKANMSKPKPRID